MAIEDYIPDFFGAGMPQYLPGLLGEQESAALQKRANVHGLLGAALTLAQGMSPGGPRRSAAQNIIGALAGGFQAGQGAYQGATQNLMMQQQIADAALKRQQAQMKIQGLQKFQEQYPNLYPIAAIDEAAAAKAATEQVLNAPIMEALGRVGGQQRQQPIASPATAVEVGGAPMVEQPQGQDQNLLPAVPVTAKGIDPEVSNLLRQKDILMRRNQELSGIPMERAQSLIKNNIDQIKTIDEQISRLSTSIYDFSTLYKVVPKEYHARLDNLEGAAMSGALTADQFTTKVDNILKDANVTTDQIRNYKFAQQNGYTGSFVDFKKISTPQTNVNVAVTGEKEMFKERGKEAVKAEGAAFSAMNAAGDVRAIVDVLKPYRGGPLDQFQASIGAYLPGTPANKLATAAQLADSIRQRLAPTIRVEGSGATSDFEARSYLNAIPSLMNTAEGRELMAVYAERFANRAAAAADIRAKMVSEGNFSVRRFQEELKAQGLTQILTPNDLKILSGEQPKASPSLAPGVTVRRVR